MVFGEDIPIQSIVAIAQATIEACKYARYYKEEIARIGVRVTFLLSKTRSWSKCLVVENQGKKQYTNNTNNNRGRRQQQQQQHHTRELTMRLHGVLTNLYACVQEATRDLDTNDEGSSSSMSFGSSSSSTRTTNQRSTMWLVRSKTKQVHTLIHSKKKYEELLDAEEQLNSILSDLALEQGIILINQVDISFENVLKSITSFASFQSSDHPNKTIQDEIDDVVISACYDDDEQATADESSTTDRSMNIFSSDDDDPTDNTEITTTTTMDVSNSSTLIHNQQLNPFRTNTNTTTNNSNNTQKNYYIREECRHINTNNETNKNNNNNNNNSNIDPILDDSKNNNNNNNNNSPSEDLLVTKTSGRTEITATTSTTPSVAVPSSSVRSKVVDLDEPVLDDSDETNEDLATFYVHKLVYDETCTAIDKNGNPISQLLGRGKFSRIYSGMYDHQTPVAVKIIDIDFREFHGLSDEILQQEYDELIKEAILMRKCCIHRNIVEMLGWYTPIDRKTKPIFVMELMDQSLYTLLHKSSVYELQQKLTYVKKLHLLKGIASALQFLHVQKIIHRDVRTQNILVDKDWNIAKLTDFGEAKIKESLTTRPASASSTSTMIQNSQQQLQQHSNNNGRMGPKQKSTPIRGACTAPYDAPEILLGQVETTSRVSEMYSFGVVLWECLTGLKPHDGKTESQITLLASRRSDRLLEVPNEPSSSFLLSSSFTTTTTTTSTTSKNKNFKLPTSSSLTSSLLSSSVPSEIFSSSIETQSWTTLKTATTLCLSKDRNERLTAAEAFILLDRHELKIKKKPSNNNKSNNDEYNNNNNNNNNQKKKSLLKRIFGVGGGQKTVI